MNWKLLLQRRMSGTFCLACHCRDQTGNREKEGGLEHYITTKHKC